MRALMIDDNAHATAARMKAFAEMNHYRVGSDAPIPGDVPGHVGMFGSYRAVLSITHMDGGIFRHITVSVPGGMLPHPIAVFILADLLGLTGWNETMSHNAPPDWLVGLDGAHRAAAVAPIGSDERANA